MSFSSQDFRRAMGHFATGITTVTTVLDGKYYGITVNAFCSVSLNPPLVLISIDKTTKTHAVLAQSRVYAVNILSENQQEYSARFARREGDSVKTFDDIKFTTGETGSPLFEEALAYADCRVVAEYEGGDHTLFMAEVLDIHYNQSEKIPEPIIYYRSNYRSLKD